MGNRHRIFTYGTLKRGFSNHVLLQEMMSTGDASFLGVYTTLHCLPLVCGPYNVPLLLNMPGCGGAHRVTGELYEVSDSALHRMDLLEGTSYQRLPIHLLLPFTTTAEAYFAHQSFAEELWNKKKNDLLLSEYTHNHTTGYVRRKDRHPPHFTFLDHIRLFLSSSNSMIHHENYSQNNSPDRQDG